MKYIKLYENFDRYDFKKHTLLTNTKGELAEMYTSMVEESRIPFEKEELDVIKSINNASEIYYVGTSNVSYVCYRFNGMNKYNSGVYLYAHGDYCYSIFELERSDIKSIETFDGFDELCVELRKIVDLNTNINESFDRYDFGVIDDEDQIHGLLPEISDNMIDLTTGELDLIKSILGSTPLTSSTGYVVINSGTVFDMLNIYSLGDYCYVLIVGGFSKRGYTYQRMYTIDDMENLLYVIKDEMSR
jgi:hypothetical protein